jgi:hypothetical protein
MFNVICCDFYCFEQIVLYTDKFYQLSITLLWSYEKRRRQSITNHLHQISEVARRTCYKTTWCRTEAA